MHADASRVNPAGQAIDHLRATWRVQAAVLTLGTIVFGWTAHLLLGASAVAVPAVIVAVVFAIAALGASAAPLGGVDARRTGRMLVRAGVTMMPAAVAGALVAVLASVHPLLGVLFVPPAMLVIAVCPAATVLAVVRGADRDDAAWLPEDVVAIVRPRPWRFAAFASIALVAFPLALVPVALTSVLIATIGPTLWLGVGLGGSVAVIALALVGRWASSVCAMPDSPRDASIAHTSSSANWQRVHGWRAVVDAATPGGEWIDVAAPASLGIRVTSAAAHRVMLYGPEGAWLHVGTCDPANDLIVVQFAAGRSFVQVQPLEPALAAQSIFVEVLFDAHQHAAA